MVHCFASYMSNKILHNASNYFNIMFVTAATEQIYQLHLSTLISENPRLSVPERRITDIYKCSTPVEYGQCQ